MSVKFSLVDVVDILSKQKLLFGNLFHPSILLLFFSNKLVPKSIRVFLDISNGYLLLVNVMCP